MKYLYIIILVLSLNSINAECQWKRVYRHYENQGLQQYDLSCADEMNCISVASPGATGSMFIKTTDGGYNWFVQFADTAKLIYNDKGQWIDTEGPKYNPIRCIDYVTPSFAVAGHQWGQITITRDGGLTWDSLHLNTNFNIKKIQFVDENYGIAFAFSDIFRTYDSGYHWEKIDLKYKNEFKTNEINLDVIGKDSLILVVYDETDSTHKYYTIYKTLNGGQSWLRGNKTQKYAEWHPQFSDMEHGWMAGRVGAGSGAYSDLIYYTSNGGESWVSQLDTLINPQLGLSGIYFSNNYDGLAYGEGGKIWRTTNGGNNWIQDKSFPFASDGGKSGDHFQKLAFPNKNTKKILANVYLFGEIWMYEDLTSVDENGLDENDLGIYPNPAGDFIAINTGSKGLKPFVETANVKIFDMLGIEVFSTPSLRDTPQEGNFRIDVSGLQPGVYFIRIGDKTEKFVKM